MQSANEDAYSYTSNVSLSQGDPWLPSKYQSGPAISVTISQPPSNRAHDGNQSVGVRTSPSLRSNGAPALKSPRIEITAYGHFPDDELKECHNSPVAECVNSIVTLTLPSADGYRDPSCLSPASSVSSRSCHSEASSLESGFSYNYDNSPQNSPWQSPCVSPKGSPSLALPNDVCTSAASPRHSPCTSPRASATDSGWTSQRGSRPNSPCGGKRKYSLNGNPTDKYPYSPNPSPGPSPHTSPRLSVTDDGWMPNCTNQYTNSAIVAAINALTTDGVADLGEGIPLKARKTSLEPGVASLKVEPSGEKLSPGEMCQEEIHSQRPPFKEENHGRGFLDVPHHPYSWSKQKQYVSPSLPALDWQLPASSGPYSLQIEVQPKSHHRAHYETEGSRGAVKAASGGHPVVQLHGYPGGEPLTLELFIGTADDRILRPHAFYQVHRITGKTVSTPSQEVLRFNTKVLEIPLLFENNMRAVIDCAGILKLRNSDIELRKGETDIGRKNTRVRMVFRVHISQSTSRTVSLQVASHPIECSQRSAQELPLVDSQTLATCPASGGVRMLLSGHNFQHDSKVVFIERAQGGDHFPYKLYVFGLNGQHLWETEAKVDKSSSNSTSLVIDVPPYQNQRTSNPVQVNFYVCNGRRKKSQYQSFIYVPANGPKIKLEPRDEYDLPQEGPFSAARCPTSPRCIGGNSTPVTRQLSKVPKRAGHVSSPATALSIKQEPQDLDQMYLDDVNEIIRNDLSNISVHTQCVRTPSLMVTGGLKETHNRRTDV
ncbi:hypothetical protein DPEC_G00203310 [Dallia pectoralis]|uniref:Uncharacterized protein n=1 Tax=Dallia pectoralis TaxID=75939 RepID=A0ACC2G9T9_DALPE|nr:hypothetical protein DPEC_G00203310 [Dallia pectoralis]